MEIHTFSLKKMHLNMLSMKFQPICVGLNVTKTSTGYRCRVWTHKGRSIALLLGRAMECILWVFWKKWLCYKSVWLHAICKMSSTFSRLQCDNSESLKLMAPPTTRVTFSWKQTTIQEFVKQINNKQLKKNKKNILLYITRCMVHHDVRESVPSLSPWPQASDLVSQVVEPLQCFAWEFTLQDEIKYFIKCWKLYSFF